MCPWLIIVRSNSFSLLDGNKSQLKSKRWICTGLVTVGPTKICLYILSLASVSQQVMLSQKNLIWYFNSLASVYKYVRRSFFFKFGQTFLFLFWSINVFAIRNFFKQNTFLMVIPVIKPQPWYRQKIQLSLPIKF